MRRHHRLFIAGFFALTLLPALAQIVGLSLGGGALSDEKRALAPRPELPRSASDALALPGRLDAYWNDHFGLRAQLIAAGDRIRWSLLHEIAAPQLTLGAHGTIYFNSHEAAHPLALLEYLCGVGVSAADRGSAAARVTIFLRRALALHPRSDLLVVPTKSTVHPDDLPAWLRDRCRETTPPVPVLVAALRADPELAPHVAYPLDEMRALQTRLDVFPRENFHWAGEGPRRVVEDLAERVWGLARVTDLRSEERAIPSDVQHFLPGVPLLTRVQVPDYRAAKIEACERAACVPDLGRGADAIALTRAALAALADVSRYRNPAAPRTRLLLITDSFGHPAAGYFSEHFGEVLQVSTNNLAKLSSDERRALHAALYDDYAPDRVLYLYHDYALPLVDGMAGPLLAP